MFEPIAPTRLEVTALSRLFFLGLLTEPGDRDKVAALIVAAVDAMLELKVPVAEARSLAPRIAEAFVAHYAGDEKRPAGELLPTKGLSLIGRIVVANRRPLVEGLWTDLPPVDNDFVLDLQTGEAP